jgi:cytoskeletal protein CcmA (bactofilin family)
MVRKRSRTSDDPTPVISIIGPGMEVVGDCRTDGSIRIEGRVHGEVHAGKAVVVGKDGTIEGDLRAEDVVIAGEVDGSVVAASRLEVHETARIHGRVIAGSLKLAEGAVLNGEVSMEPHALDGTEHGRVAPASPTEDGAEVDPVRAPVGIS